MMMNLGLDYISKFESVGVFVVVCEVKVVDFEGEEVLCGEVGEIWIKGLNVVVGYWNKLEVMVEMFLEGWLCSGDFGCMDEDGFVFIFDWVKDMFICGGENIYCVEVEDVFYSYFVVMDVVVVGMLYKVFGEEVVVIV